MLERISSFSNIRAASWCSHRRLVQVRIDRSIVFYHLNLWFQLDRYSFVWIPIRNVSKRYLFNFLLDSHRVTSMTSKNKPRSLDFVEGSIVKYFSSTWMFNIILLDAATSNRRLSIRHGVEKDKYENLL